MFSKYAQTSKQFFRSVVSGGTFAVFNIAAIYVFTEFFGWYYLFSASVSFLIVLVSNFLLQKYWVFEERSSKIAGQFVAYTLLGGANYFLNIVILYAFTEYVHLWYVLSQCIAAGILAVMNFVVGKRYVFRGNERVVN